MKTIRRLAVCLAAAACAGGPREPAADRQDGVSIVVQGTEMSGALLDGLRTRVPTMRIRRQDGTCPSIMFRGSRSAERQGNPTVYVDGTMMLDTCVLMQISTDDVDFVEIYPSGVSSRPGIQRNPFGVIFIQRTRH